MCIVCYVVALMCCPIAAGCYAMLRCVALWRVAVVCAPCVVSCLYVAGIPCG